jgi:hypothetical protein
VQLRVQHLHCYLFINHAALSTPWSTHLAQTGLPQLRYSFNKHASPTTPALSTHAPLQMQKLQPQLRFSSPTTSTTHNNEQRVPVQLLSQTPASRDSCSKLVRWCFHTKYPTEGLTPESTYYPTIPSSVLQPVTDKIRVVHPPPNRP